MYKSMDHNLPVWPAFLYSSFHWPSKAASSQSLSIFLLYHSRERISEVLKLSYKTQHQNVVWYWPNSSMYSPKLPSNLEFNKKSHFNSYRYTRHPTLPPVPIPTSILSFPSLAFLLALPLLPTPPYLLSPQKQKEKKKTWSIDFCQRQRN